MKKRGTGYACMIYGVGFGFGRPDNAGAYVEMAEDGTVTVLCGGADMGQGLAEMLALIAAEELGVRQADVRVINAETLEENVPMTRILKGCGFEVEEKERNVMLMCLRLF